MARRKSFQHGYVQEVKNKSCTVFRLKYRVRSPHGGWSHKTETLRHCRSKKEARKVLERRLREINGTNGGLAAFESKRFIDLLGSCWENYLETQGVEDSTRYSWNSILNKWLLPFFGNRVLDEIEPSDIGDFMGYLASEGLAAKTRKNIYQLLDLMLGLARENGFMASNPIRPRIHRPKVVRKEKQSFDPEQARAIYALAAPAYRAPIATLLLTGIRAGELLGLRWKDIDFLGRRIAINGSVWRGKLKSTKTESSVAEIGMPAPLAGILLEHRQSSGFTDPDDLVFCQADGRPLDPDSLRRNGIYPALEKAGIEYVKGESGCHAFRHLAASVIHSQTGSVKLAQKQLRHSNISTTGDIYTHLEDSELDRMAAILGDTLGANCGRSVVETAQDGENVQ